MRGFKPGVGLDHRDPIDDREALVHESLGIVNITLIEWMRPRVEPGIDGLLLALATALHPTPAVCGVPVDAARKTIRSIETFDRSYYTGMVGWDDAHGDGDWVLTIRCAEAAGRSLRVFAGAGIVAGSRPRDELAETAAKCRTLLRAIGLEQLEQVRLRAAVEGQQRSRSRIHPPLRNGSHRGRAFLQRFRNRRS